MREKLLFFKVLLKNLSKHFYVIKSMAKAFTSDSDIFFLLRKWIKIKLTLIVLELEQSFVIRGV